MNTASQNQPFPTSTAKEPLLPVRGKRIVVQTEKDHKKHLLVN
jgi:hypothetical protein